MRRRDKVSPHSNEALVLATSSLQGERRVAIVRLIVVLMMSVSQVFIAWGGGKTYSPPLDGLRLQVIGAYVFFSVVAIVVLMYQRPEPHRARWLPVPTALADTFFFSFMAWHTWRLSGEFDAGMLCASLGMVLAFSVVRYSWWHVLLSTVLSCVAYALLAWMTGHGSVARVSFVLICYAALGALIALTNSDVGGMFLNLRRRDGLSRFLPKQVVERVMQLGDASLQPVQRDVTILFSDIRDFTALSETLEPSEVLEFLDDYFGHMAHIVMARQGIVNKFLGDGMLACWGVPDAREDHAELALRAALDMRAKLEDINAQRIQRGLAPLRIGIGLHTGMVAAGMLGGAEQHEYTVIGDAVNLASRVEGLTKSHGVDILVSERTWMMGGGHFAGERLGEAHVKGRRESVVVYSLLGPRTAQTPEEPVFRAATGT